MNRKKFLLFCEFNSRIEYSSFPNVINQTVEFIQVINRFNPYDSIRLFYREQKKTKQKILKFKFKNFLFSKN